LLPALSLSEGVLIDILF